MGWGVIAQKLLGWEKIKEITVDTDTDTVSFTNLNGLVDSFYMLLATVKNPTTSNANYRIYVEDDTDPANYYHQYFVADSTSVTSDRANNPNAFNVAANERSFICILINIDPDKFFRYFSLANEQTGSTQILAMRAGSKTTTITNITRIDIISTVSSAIGAGSKFVLLRCKSG